MLTQLTMHGNMTAVRVLPFAISDFYACSADIAQIVSQYAQQEARVGWACTSIVAGGKTAQTILLSGTRETTIHDRDNKMMMLRRTT